MVLVSYSDSEGSDDERSQAPPKQDTNVTTAKPDTEFTVDRSNPRKIKVNLHEIKDDATSFGGRNEEPASKRPKIGGGFAGFNSILPAPKRDSQSTGGVKAGSSAIPRKVFSLKTGAEPGFSRESDAELKQLFAEQDSDRLGKDFSMRREDMEEITGKETGLALPSVPPPAPTRQGNPMMFKPLSVARNSQKKKKPPEKTSAATPATQSQKHNGGLSSDTSVPAPKVNLFSIGDIDMRPAASSGQQGTYEPLIYETSGDVDDPDPMPNDTEGQKADPAASFPDPTTETESQSLDTIAADLNLSASAKRQLLGRNHKNAAITSSSIINFNTDQEYAANEVLRASGEQVQHNPVRAIAPGRHSLKQLVSAASGQKDALEESFASGRRNKKEAGSRYGW